MNNVILTGRLVRDPEVKYGSEIAICKFTVAVNRPKKQGQKENECDFINCVCFGKKGETIGNYMAKGSKIDLRGSIRIGNYDDKKTGKKVYTTEVFVDEWEFGEGKGSPKQATSSTNTSTPFDEEISF